MNETLSVLSAYGSLITLGLAAAIFRYPLEIAFLSFGGAAVLLTWTSRRQIAKVVLFMLRVVFSPVSWFIRKWNWHVWYRIQRGYHKLRKYFRSGRQMPKWKYVVVTDEIDEAMRKLQDACILTPHLRRRILKIIGEALKTQMNQDFHDLIPRKRNAKGMRHTIMKNIESVKAGPKGPIPGKPEPSPADNVVELSYLKSRRSAA